MTARNVSQCGVPRGHRPRLQFADDVESFWTSHKKGFRPGRIGIAQFDSLKSPEQHGDCDLRLKSRQMIAQTNVRAPTKSEMGIVFSLDVESIGIGKPLWIAIGGSNQDDERLARFQRLLEELVSRRDDSRDSLNGPLES